MKSSRNKLLYTEEGPNVAHDEGNLEAAWAHVDRWRPSRLEQLSAQASESGRFTYYNPVAAAPAPPALPARPRPSGASGKDRWQRQRQEWAPRAVDAIWAHENQGHASPRRTGQNSQQRDLISGVYRHRSSRRQSPVPMELLHAPTSMARELAFPLLLFFLFVAALVALPFLMIEHQAHAATTKAVHAAHAAFAGTASMGQANDVPFRKWQQHNGKMRRKQEAKRAPPQPSSPPLPPSPPRARLDVTIQVSCDMESPP